MTGRTAEEWDALVTALLTLHEDQREVSLDNRRGHRPRVKGDGTTGRRPILTLADRLVATVLHYRLALPQVTIATLFNVHPGTINRRIREIRQLLETAGQPIQLAAHQLATLDDLHALANTADITTPPEIKTAG